MLSRSLQTVLNGNFSEISRLVPFSFIMGVANKRRIFDGKFRINES